MGRMIVWLLLFSLACSASDQATENASPKITPAPAGPYHVRGNRILDANDREYLIRGTQLPTLTPKDAFDSGNASDFRPFSGTNFITIRQRLNMNAVRLPLDAQEYETNDLYRTRVAKIVQQANQLELLVILDLGP